MPDLPYLRRHVDDELDLLLQELPAVLLTGPRACGKTTTAGRRACSVMRLDRGTEAAAFRAAPDAVLAAQRPPVLLDEWQSVPESMGAIKRAVDAGAAAGSYLVTGSVRARLGSAGWPATGRVVPLPLYGLTVAELTDATRAASFVESCFGTDDPPAERLDPAPTLVDDLGHAMRGGFPEAVNLSDRARSAWYDGYVEQLVRHDVPEIADVRSSAGLEAVLRAVALNTAGLPAMTTLADAARLDHRTVRAYLDVLDDLRIVERTPAWATNRLSRLLKTPKYYVLDPGMAVALAGDSLASLVRDADRLGRIVDTFVAAQLRPLVRLCSPQVRMYHLRDTNGDREVDIVLESAAGNVVGLEVKAAETVHARDARHLAWLRDRLGDRFRRGVVLHTGSTTFPLGDRLWAIPVARLWTPA